MNYLGLVHDNLSLHPLALVKLNYVRSELKLLSGRCDSLTSLQSFNALSHIYNCFDMLFGKECAKSRKKTT